MKLIEPTRKQVRKGSFQKLIDQIGQLLSIANPAEVAEDAIIARFMQGLDNSFFMLRDLPIEGTDQTFPPILIGPTGLMLLNVSLARGFFRAKDESWWEMSKTAHRFSPGRPNLIKQSQEYAQRLAGQLDKHEKSHPGVVPVLIFANPGVHIETSTPAIRIVRMDGVDSLLSNLRTGEEVLATNEINSLADALEIIVNPNKVVPMEEEEDFFGRDLLGPEEKSPPRLPKIKLPTNLSLPQVDEKFKFTPRQWLILEVLMGLTIVVLLAGIIYILLMY